MFVRWQNWKNKSRDTITQTMNVKKCMLLSDPLFAYHYWLNKPFQIQSTVVIVKFKMCIFYHYRPHSEPSEGYVFTGICLSNSRGGREEWTRDQDTTPPSLLPPDMVTTTPSPPLGHGHNTSLPPGHGHNTSLPPGHGYNTSLHHPSPRTWSQHLPSPGTWSQHPPPSPTSYPIPPLPSLPLGPGHSTSLPPPPPSPQELVTTPPCLPDYAQAGSTHPIVMHSGYLKSLEIS